jgi:class 3 adenylate cyclase
MSAHKTIITSIKQAGKGIGHEIYPMRIVGYLVLCAVLWFKLKDLSPKESNIYWAWAVYFFAYPHLVFLVYVYLKSSNKIEKLWLVLDLFWIGIAVVMIDFSLLPTMALIVYSTSTCIGIGGLKMWLQGLLAFGLSMLLMWLFWGKFVVSETSSFGANLIGFLYMFIGFNAYNFAYYRRSLSYKKVRLQIEKQREEIAEQKEEIQSTLALVETERLKSDTLLLNILPLETALELKETGQAKPTQYELVSVLFTDFKGFTSIAEKLTPHEVIQALNTCFLAFDEICERYNLEKIKTVGDSYMCAGGVPVANRSNPVDVVRAALSMQAYMLEWQQSKAQEGRQAWEIRLGIHSGEVIAGVVGNKKFAYDIWGDTVNTASRMESSGEAGKVNISGTTYELIKHQFDCTFRGKINAKNKGEVDMYFVERLKP